MQHLVSISCTKKFWVSFVLFLWVILFLKNIERSEKWNQHWNPKPTLKSNQFQSQFESNSKINSKTKIRDCLHEEREGTKSGTGRSFYPAFRAIYLRSGTGDGIKNGMGRYLSHLHGKNQAGQLLYSLYRKFPWGNNATFFVLIWRIETF